MRTLLHTSHRQPVEHYDRRARSHLYGKCHDKSGWCALFSLVFLTAMLDRIISSPISKPHIWHHFSWELFSLDELETGDRALLQTSRTTNQNIKNGRKITGITIITGHSADICADVFQGIK